jgi:hypothetical protein
MSKFLSCSLEGIEVFGNVTILLASDERDPCYRSAIQGLIEGLGHGFVDLDAIVWKTLKDYVTSGGYGKHILNNMFVYQVTTMIAGIFNFKLEQHRHFSCPDCTSLLQTPAFENLPRVAAPQQRVETYNWSNVNEAYNACRMMVQSNNSAATPT